MSENPFADLIPQKKAEPKKPSRGSFADPLAQGATFGFADELAGAFAAGMQAMGFEGGLGKMTPAEAYAAYRDRVRGDVEGYREEHPVKAAIGELGGALATAPVTGSLNVLRGGGLLARAGNAAATGAAYGGAYGAGTAEGGLKERVEGAAKGAAFGAVAGGAAPIVLRGGKLVLDAAKRPLQRAFAAVNPEKEASRRLVDAISRDTGGEPERAVTMLQDARRQGTPLIVADTGTAAGGRRTQSLVRTAANLSPEARSVLEPVLQQRFDAQNIRAATVLRNLVRTPANATVTREALQDTARTARKPFYDRAYRDGANGVLTPEIEQLVQSPAMQTAMRAAATSIKNKTAAGRAMNPLSKNGTPTLEFWDQTKRNLDSAWNVANRQGDKELAADIDAIRRTLVSQLDAAVPSYSTARGVAATLFKANDALDAGEKFVSSRMRNDEASQALTKMTPEERTLFREGFVSKFIDDVMQSKDRRSILNQINASPDARERMEIALGPQNYQKLEAFLRIENVMQMTKDALGNSTTVRQWIEGGLAGGGLGLIMNGGNLSDPKLALMAVLGGAARRGVGIVDAKVAERVGEMLVSDDPDTVQKAIDMVSTNPRMLGFLRNVEDALARAAALLPSVAGQGGGTSTTAIAP